LPFQIHFSVTNENADEIPSLIDFARSVGAHVLNIFFLVCTGRGETMSDITPERYEQVLNQLIEAQEQSKDLIIRARCAPHYKRIAYQRDPQSPLTRAEGYEGGGCLAGIHYCRITPEGAVTACPYIPDEEGNIRDQSFWEIWEQSATFQGLRNPSLTGKCGECEFRQLCGGCRARPKALGGTLMDADPLCVYQPQEGEVVQPLRTVETAGITWSSEAEQRLGRVPGFLRKMVKKRAETYASEQGAIEVTAEHLSVLAARRFSGGTPFPQRPVAEEAKSPKVRDHRGDAPVEGLPWTAEARLALESVPEFLREGVRQVTEDVAREEGRLEVNLKLVRRLEEQDISGKSLPWEPLAEQVLEEHLADRGMEVRMFVEPTLRAAAERECERREAITVSPADVHRVLMTHTAGVEWDDEALARVRSAPEF
ncbi:MAG: SPASM domain-containing protein, partial [Gammaproteobacteria bacterium]|nr:SPASM domain-containing protein [Gammaproteobacteria bacterium]